MEVVVKVCIACGLPVSEANTDYLHGKGTSTVEFGVHAAGQAYKQANRFEYLRETTTDTPGIPVRRSRDECRERGDSTLGVCTSCTID